MKIIVRWLFRTIAQGILRREHPVVIAVAGSVGKTGTKDAVAAAVATSQRTIRKTIGNFNGEVGVPLTILAGGAAPTSLWQWAMALGAGVLQLITHRAYPKALILELGADKPGDLRPLITLCNPTISILTAVTAEHMEFFDTLDAVVAEESLIVRMLPATGIAIINRDDPPSVALLPKLTSRVVTFGWDTAADVRIDQLRITYDEHGLPTGQVMKVAVGGSVIPVPLPGVLGRHQGYPIAAALAVAYALGDEIFETIQRLGDYEVPPGRMRLFRGVEGTMLIDDSYNASPAAMASAINALMEVTIPGKKHVILGQMSELGAGSNAWHDDIGAMLKPESIATIITVGTLAKRIGDAAIAKRFPAARVLHVDSAEAAATKLRALLAAGDITLIKGSHYPKVGYSGFLGEAVKILLADPRTDEAYLVPRIPRQ